ncbi:MULTISPECIES: hypothetical protein [unclassified Novosphingobium]|uniref:hypothetical protein n=1 Tax=unclassified Novosphingobium TaxID=2644732 RepID=UPI0025FB0795|nr:MULTISPECIES: hypothetical protein [unclassified Novosphingobium]
MSDWIGYLIFCAPFLAAWGVKEAIEKASVRASIDTDRLVQSIDVLSAQIGSLESGLDSIRSDVREVVQNTEPPRMSTDHFDI